MGELFKPIPSPFNISVKEIQQTTSAVERPTKNHKNLRLSQISTYDSCFLQISSDLGNCPPRQGIACKFQMANLLLQELAGKGAGHRLGTLEAKWDSKRQKTSEDSQIVVSVNMSTVSAFISSRA